MGCYAEGKKGLRRMPFLAMARNRVLEPLFELWAEGGRNGSFDGLLFLNDVIFIVRIPPIRQICWRSANL